MTLRAAQPASEHAARFAGLAQIASERGYSRLKLDLDERNRIASASAAYQRAGFTQIDGSKKIRPGSERWGRPRLARPVSQAV